jgi:4-hydroxy-tetrahydrodipicolinate reductase
MPLKVLLNGAAGRMGKAIAKAADPAVFDLAFPLELDDDPDAAVPACDVIIDFSFHDATLSLVQLAAEYCKPIVIGTTGHSTAEREQVLAYAEKVPMVWSGNYSIGMNLLFYLTKRAAETLSEIFEPEITEVHHHFKKDAPSGTAMDLARRICNARDWDINEVLQHGRSGITGERPERQIGMHALRGGDVVGEHTVSFFGEGERVELRHLATDRTIFAHGALASARWVVGKAPGLYEMQDVLNLR